MGEKCKKAFGLLGFCHYGHGRDPGDPDASARLRVEPHAPGRTADCGRARARAGPPSGPPAGV